MANSATYALLRVPKAIHDVIRVKLGDSAHLIGDRLVLDGIALVPMEADPPTHRKAVVLAEVLAECARGLRSGRNPEAVARVLDEAIVTAFRLDLPDV